MTERADWLPPSPGRPTWLRPQNGGRGRVLLATITVVLLAAITLIAGFLLARLDVVAEVPNVALYAAVAVADAVVLTGWIRFLGRAPQSGIDAAG